MPRVRLDRLDIPANITTLGKFVQALCQDFLGFLSCPAHCFRLNKALAVLVSANIVLYAPTPLAAFDSASFHLRNSFLSQVLSLSTIHSRSNDSVSRSSAS